MKTEHLWKPGQSGNPAGKPKGSRNKLSEDLIRDVSEVWAERGRDIIEKLATDEPAKFAELATKLVPKEFLLSVAPRLPGGLEPDEWSMMLETVAAIKECFPGARDPGAVMTFVAEAIRLRTSRPVDTGDSGGQLLISHDIQTRGQNGQAIE